MLLVQHLFDKDKGFKLNFDHQDLYFPISNKYRTFWERLIKDEDIIITTSYNVKRTPNIALRSKLKRIPLVVYHSEQFYNKVFNKEKLNLDHISDYLKDVHYHFVWGDYYKSKLIEAGVSEEKIFVVGSIKEEVADLVVAQNSNKEYDFLFIANFVLADFSSNDLETFKQQFNLPCDYDPREYFQTSRKEMVRFISDISELYPAKKILVRRHPGESKSYYEPLLKFNNVQISSDEPISEDIKKTKVVFLQDSTSIFELERCGANWVSVMFGNENKQYKGEPVELFDCHDKHKVKECIKNDTLKKLYGSMHLKKVGIDYYSISERTSDKLHSAITTICRREHKFHYNFRFIKNFIVLLIKLTAWKSSITLNNMGIKNSLYKGLKAKQGIWEKGDHIIEKGMIEKFNDALQNK